VERETLMPITNSPSSAVLGRPNTTTFPAPDVSDIYVPSSGAWLGNSPGARTLTEHETDLARTVDIAHVFRNFAHYDTVGEDFPGTTQQGYIDGGRMLLWNLKPLDTTWTAIAAGSQDSRIDIIADNVVQWELGAGGGRKTFMAFHHEPEDDVGVFGTALEYAAAFRRVRDRFTARGVTSVIYVWIVTGYQTRVDQWAALYPGDAYVDWLGYDPYPVTCTSFSTGSTNDPFFEAFGEYPGQAGVDDTGKYRFYKWATGSGGGSRDSGTANDYVKAGDLTKPILTGEWAASEDPAAPADRMVPIFNDWKTAVEQTTYPQIKAYVYWESGESGTCTHRINVTANTKAAFKAVTDLPQLRQPRPY
jgi:hypothetical protein